MKYYDVFIRELGGDMRTLESGESKHGEWCRREEVDAELERLNKELEAMKLNLEHNELYSHCPRCSCE